MIRQAHLPLDLPEIQLSLFMRLQTLNERTATNIGDLLPNFTVEPGGISPTQNDSDNTQLHSHQFLYLKGNPGRSRAEKGSQRTYYAKKSYFLFWVNDCIIHVDLSKPASLPPLPDLAASCPVSLTVRMAFAHSEMASACHTEVLTTWDHWGHAQVLWRSAADVLVLLLVSQGRNPSGKSVWRTPAHGYTTVWSNALPRPSVWCLAMKDAGW